ncbi:MAG: hypothetical protein ACOYIK_02105 [Coriobacteriales bacterium]
MGNDGGCEGVKSQVCYNPWVSASLHIEGYVALEKGLIHIVPSGPFDLYTTDVNRMAHFTGGSTKG